MRCEDVQDLIDAVAEGPEATPPEMAAHLQACASCSASLSRARQIDRLLSATQALVPPDRFTADVVRRTRTVRWRSEQRFDRWFNAVLVTSFLVIAAGVWGLMNVTGLASVTVGTADFVGYRCGYFGAKELRPDPQRGIPQLFPPHAVEGLTAQFHGEESIQARLRYEALVSPGCDAETAWNLEPGT